MKDGGTNYGGELATLTDLERAGALTPTSLVPPDDMTYDETLALFTYLGRIHSAARWYIGDLMAWSERRLGEDAMYQLAHESGLSENTLRRYVLVAAKIAPARRRANLSFSIHQEISATPTADQERWLELAETRRLTVADLRGMIRDEYARPEQPQWTPIPPRDVDERERHGAAGDPPTGLPPSPVETPDSLGDALRGSQTTMVVPRVIPDGRALVLVDMRDELNGKIDVLKPKGDEIPYERRRDALTWALERLAPELA